MRSLPTLIWTAARPSLVRPGIACMAGAALVGILCLIQESAPLRRMGLGFAWESCRDTVVAALLVFAVIESNRWGTERTAWELRAAPRPFFHTVQRVAATFLGLSCVSIGTTAVLFSLDRILIPWGSASEGWRCLFQALAMALPLAAWTPAVAGTSSLTGIPSAAIFGVLVALSCGALGAGVPLPLDRLPPLGDGGSPWSAGLAPACTLSTAAGLCVSVALIQVQLPRAPACGSASSATSTATSKP